MVEIGFAGWVNKMLAMCTLVVSCVKTAVKAILFFFLFCEPVSVCIYMYAVNCWSNRFYISNSTVFF